MARVATATEVGRAVGLKPNTIRRYALEGKIPCSRTPGGKRRYDIAEVRASLGVHERDAPVTATDWRALAVELDAYRGQWVAIVDDRVVQAAAALTDLRDRIRADGVAADLVRKVPEVPPRLQFGRSATFI